MILIFFFKLPLLLQSPSLLQDHLFLCCQWSVCSGLNIFSSWLISNTSTLTKFSLSSLPNIMFIFIVVGFKVLKTLVKHCHHRLWILIEPIIFFNLSNFLKIITKFSAHFRLSLLCWKIVAAVPSFVIPLSNSSTSAVIKDPAWSQYEILWNIFYIKALYQQLTWYTQIFFVCWELK